MRIFTNKDLQHLTPDTTPVQKETIRFYEGDHFQNGQGWVGPRLDAANPLYGSMMLEVQRMFTSKNVVREIVDRQVAGMVGIAPDWSVVVDRTLLEGEEPSADEQALIERASNLLQKWWARDQGLVSVEDQLWSPYKILRRALATGLLIGRAPLRIFVPVDRWLPEDNEDNVTMESASSSVALGQMAEGVTLPVLSEDEAIESVFIHFPEPDQAEVHIDHSTLRIIGIYVASVSNGTARDYELHSLENGQAIVQKYVDGELESTTTLDLYNHPLMFEIGLPELITESIRTQQKALNMALTMMSRNSVQAGFLERIILNGQLPGRETTDPATGEVTFEPEPLAVGPGMTTYIPGLPIVDAEGNRTYTTPNVVYRDPVDPSTFIKSVVHLYSNILHEVHQEHILLGDSDASGEARKQSRADFEAMLNDQQESVRGAVQWLLETVLHMFGYLMGDADTFKGLKVQVETHTYLGPLSSAEMDTIVKITEAKLLSKRAGRIRIGVRDVEAEENQLRLEEEEGGAREQSALASALLRNRSALSDPDAEITTIGDEQGVDNVQPVDRLVE